jgi:tetratricopeptide (TPR) repeat protein
LQGNCQAQKQILDSLFEIKKKIQNDSQRCEWLVDTHRYFLNLNWVSIGSFLDEAEKLAQKLGPNQKADVANEQAFALMTVSNYAEAQKKFLEAKKYYQIAQNKQGEAKTLNNISGTLQEAGLYEISLEYLNESASIYGSIDDQFGLARVWVSKAYIFKETKAFDSAIFYAERSLKRFQMLQNQIYDYQAYQVLADCYLAKNEYRKSLEMSHKSLKSIFSSKHYRHLTYSYQTMVSTYFELNQIDSAMTCALTFDSLVKQFKLEQTLGHVSKKYLSKVCEKAGKMSSAFFYLKISDSLKSLYYEEYQLKKINALRAFHNLQDSQNKLEIKDLEAIQNRNKLLWSYSFLGILVLFGSVLVYYYLKQIRLTTKLTNLNLQLRELFEEKSKLAQQYQQLNEQLEHKVSERTQKLSQAIQSISELAFINAHKTRSGVARLKGLLYIHHHQLISTEEMLTYFETSVNEIDETIKEISAKLYKLTSNLEQN